MEMTLLEISNEALEIAVKDAPLPFLNAIRRYSLAKVPTYAIDEIMVVVNTSSMYDEILAHRLAMIPLTVEEVKDRIREIDPEVCEKCSSSPKEKAIEKECETCYIHMVLEAEAKESETTVYSGDIRSEDPLIKPVYNNIPIVILAPGQRISLELRARVGRGLEHAKWSPATIAVTRYVADIKIEKELCNLCRKCIELCPKNVFEMDKDKIKVINTYNCILCKQCLQNCPIKAITISRVDNNYVLRIESSGSMRPESIIIESVYILLNELNELERFVKSIKHGAQT
ncbi:MAG: DNA-directed RNA polymerase subunit D [Ignisphaera sp.]|uniref:DNA-directed RNA polymerase subunit Rpo3 n=1 Tax=Ignisphaera aggregans TaxID=334771 RepID=A0A7J3MZ01_9CREN